MDHLNHTSDDVVSPLSLHHQTSQNRQSKISNPFLRALGARDPDSRRVHAPDKEAGVARDHASQRGRHAARRAGTHGQNTGGGEQTAIPQTTRIAPRAPLGGGSISGGDRTGDASRAPSPGLDRDAHGSRRASSLERPRTPRRRSRPRAPSRRTPNLRSRTKNRFSQPLTNTHRLSLPRMVSGGPRSRETRSQTNSTCRPSRRAARRSGHR